jgi:hypothetical protein
VLQLWGVRSPFFNCSEIRNIRGKIILCLKYVSFLRYDFVRNIFSLRYIKNYGRDKRKYSCRNLCKSICYYSMIFQNCTISTYAVKTPQYQVSLKFSQPFPICYVPVYTVCTDRPGLENRDYGRGDPLRWPRDTLYQLKLALTSPAGCCSSVGIVLLRTKTTELCTDRQIDRQAERDMAT